MQLADRLDLSKATVSLALRDSPEIAPRTRNRVKAAALAMNYVPNRVAQAMSNRRSNCIGIIVPTVNSSFFPDIINGIEQEAKNEGRQCFVCQSHSRTEIMAEEVEALLSHMVEGLIIFPVNSFVQKDLYLDLLKRPVNFVLVDQRVDGVRAPYVGNDNRKAGRLATGHLLTRGHRRIACIRGYWDSLSARDRFRGYADALADAGIALEEDLVAGNGFDTDEGYRSAQKLLKGRHSFTALVAPNDFVALGAIRALEEGGLRVPEDVAVIGCGNLDMCSWVSPSLSSIDQSPGKIGQAAMRLLAEAGPPASKKTAPRETIIDSSVVVRKSTSLRFPQAEEHSRPVFPSPSDSSEETQEHQQTR